MSEKYWLWDLYPLAREAWGNILFAKGEWADWLNEGETTIVIRRWVPGPNGPSFLAEYTPADDCIADGANGPHSTFNGLYQDEDRPFYAPQPQDILALERSFPPPADPANPSWPHVEAELVTGGQELYEIREMNAPTLVRLLQDLLEKRATTDQPAKKRRGKWPKTRTQPEVAKYLSERMKDYNRLVPLCLDPNKPKPEAVKEFKTRFGATAIARGIGDGCKAQNVELTDTYKDKIQPVIQGKPPKGWKPPQQTDSPFADDIANMRRQAKDAE